MQNLWQKIKYEFVKTFIRGDKITPYSGFITWRTHDPSRCQMWWQKIKPILQENAAIIQAVAAVIAAIVAVIALIR